MALAPLALLTFLFRIQQLPELCAIFIQKVSVHFIIVTVLQRVACPTDAKLIFWFSWTFDVMKTTKSGLPAVTQISCHMMASCFSLSSSSLGRRTNIVGGLILYHRFFLSFFLLLLSFFAALSLSLLNGTQPKSATCMEVTAIWKRMSKIWGVPSPYKSGAKHLFGPTSQLNGNFNGLYLRNKTRCRQSVSALTTTRGLLYRPKISWTLAYRRLQTGPPFLPTLRNSALYVIARLRRRRSANRTQPNFAKRLAVNRANNLL